MLGQWIEDCSNASVGLGNTGHDGVPIPILIDGCVGRHAASK